MAKTTQVLSSLNENFFDFFDFAVKKFCGSSLAPQPRMQSAVFVPKAELETPLPGC
jgi:hypothetical protein